MGYIGEEPVCGTRGDGQKAVVRVIARPTSALVIACLLLAAGCGTTDREADVTAVADRFHAALEARDGAAACAQLSAETTATLERQEQRSCAEAVVELDLPAGARASRAEVYVTSALAELAADGAVFLDETSEGWRISAAGCEPTAGDRPYDCELEN
jgi:hypothetical protein